MTDLAASLNVDHTYPDLPVHSCDGPAVLTAVGVAVDVLVGTGTANRGDRLLVRSRVPDRADVYGVFEREARSPNWHQVSRDMSATELV